MSKKPELTLVKNELPHWLLPPRSPSMPLSENDLAYICEQLVAGNTLSSIVRDHEGLPDYGRVLQWILSDPKRKALYYEAKEMQTERWEDVMTEKALDMGDDGVPEELERTKMVLSHLKWLVAMNNRKRYGDQKQISIIGQIDIGAAMAKADERLEQQLGQQLEQGLTLDHED